MGQDGHGSIIKNTGGLITGNIKCLPPKQTVEFTPTGESATVVTVESALPPDEIAAEVSAEWEHPEEKPQPRQ